MQKMNKPIKFFGLTSIQFGTIMLCTALTIIFFIFNNLHPLIIASIIVLIFFLFTFLFSRLQKEHKAGNPDYLKGTYIKKSTPGKIVDKKKIFQFIYNK
ncbi:hypothetical protein FNJ60_10480 [Bacteroides pyogenes]|uniref:DUF4133 domain-containing protein n=2 Tax=Bacteroides pyogenes TaxID=310300 RepID=A0A5D3EAI1_9BACE|nr:hypothetical protein FNJ60_10480 [Bacteroides pyogenes]